MTGRATVVLFIDALGADVVTRHGFLAGEPGSHHRLRTVIGYSSSAIPSLLTGRLPREHGHFSMYRRDLGQGVFRAYRPLMLLAHHTKGRGKLRQFLKRRLSRRIGGYFELYDLPLNVLSEFDLCQRHDIFAPGGVPPHETFLDVVARSGLDHRIWSWRVPEERAYGELLADLSAGRSSFLLLYSAELDALMHRAGVGDERVAAKLRTYETWIGEIRRAAADRELHLFVFSDHGMTDVTAVHDVHGALAATDLRVPRDYLVFSDSTMARFWFRRPGAREAIHLALPDTSWGRWLSAEDVEAYGIDFPDHRYGEATYLLEAGHVIAPSYMGERACAAMHGYGPEDSSADAWLFTSSPPASPPRSILDLKSLFVDEVRWLAGSTPPADARFSR